MKTTLLAAAVALTLGSLATVAALQDEGAVPLVQPSPEHALLSRLSGTWDAELDFGGPPTSGTFERSLEMGDLWLVSDFERAMIDAPFTGHEVFGWDPSRKSYVGTWVDSMSTYVTHLEGSFDEGTKTLTLVGEGLDPATGEPTTMANVTRIEDADHVTYTMHMGPTAADPKLMTIRYTRKR